MNSLENIAVLVSGGASGMGAATAEHLALKGAKVTLLDMNIDKANALANKLNAQAFQCDVQNADNVEEVVIAAQKKHGVARVLVNCAGVAPGKRIVGKSGMMPLEDFQSVININLIGTFNMMRVMAYHLSEHEPVGETQERGVIINTASIAAFEGQIGQAAYSASKGGIVGMTLACARDLAKFGIRVMTIAPGIMKTPMMAAMPENVQQSLAEQMSFPQRLGEANEYAALVEHIIHNEYLNGETIRLDAAIRMQAK